MREQCLFKLHLLSLEGLHRPLLLSSIDVGCPSLSPATESAAWSASALEAAAWSAGGAALEPAGSGFALGAGDVDADRAAVEILAVEGEGALYSLRRVELDMCEAFGIAFRIGGDANADDAAALCEELLHSLVGRVVGETADEHRVAACLIPLAALELSAAFLRRWGRGGVPHVDVAAFKVSPVLCEGLCGLAVGLELQEALAGWPAILCGERFLLPAAAA